MIIVKNDCVALRTAIARRLVEIRREKYGDAEMPILAATLRVPVQTWLNDEAGVKLPGETLLRFIDVSGVDPHWLLTGAGAKYTSANAREIDDRCACGKPVVGTPSG